MSDAAALEVNARGRFWVGFRASSHRQDRRLQLSGPGAETYLDVRAERPSVYVAGPFATGNASRYRLQVRAVPAARRASRRDVRRLSVFLSTPRVSRSPFAALPGRGFYPSETEVDGSPFNWLRQDGRIDVASASPRSTVAWIRFRARSIDRARQVDVRGAARTWRFTAPPFTSPPREIVIGPIELRDGRASVVLRSTTPPRRYGADTRALSVSVSRLEVLDGPPATRLRPR
jgi:hypothetical protein